MQRDTQSNHSSTSLNWTGYIYGGLAHSFHIQYDEQSEARGEASVRRGLKRMGLEPEYIRGRRVLDVGTGLYGLGFHRLGAVVEHYDISTRTVCALNTYAQERGYANLKSLHTDLVSDELPDEHFDLIYLSGVFQHFENPACALANLSRSLKRGGRIYIDIYRSGRWRWFVVDVLRKITGRSLLYDVLQRFTEFSALAVKRSFHLRQVELLIDDLFVENLHLLHPDDLKADAEALGLELMREVTSMDLVDSGDRVDHALFFAHVFNTLVFCKITSPDTTSLAERCRVGRCQIEELKVMSGSYRDLFDLTAEFVLAHQAGKFSREEVISHVVNLFRMAHPCLPGDPYMELGIRESGMATSVIGDDRTLSRRHALWCTFCANVLGISNPLKAVELQSLGYELVRFLS